MMEFHYYLGILKEKEKPLYQYISMVILLIQEREFIELKDILIKIGLFYQLPGEDLAEIIGNPTDKNLYIDGEAAIKWIIENTNYQFKDLVIYGESLGSGIALNWEENMNLPQLSWKLLSQQLQILHNNDIYFSNKIFN